MCGLSMDVRVVVYVYIIIIISFMKAFSTALAGFAVSYMTINLQKYLYELKE